MTYDFRIASGKKPLYDHTSPDTAYVIDDYPHGFRDRCKKRVWLEFKAKQGWRLVEQTSQPWYPGSGESAPPDDQLRWAKPKMSTYAPVGACMYLDGQGHVQWDQLGLAAQPPAIEAFMKDFPKADFGGIKVHATYYTQHYFNKLRGAVVMTMNGEPRPWSESELEDARKDLGAWLEIAKEVKVSFKPHLLQECKDLVEGKTPAKMIDPEAWKAEKKQQEEAAAEARREKAENTKGALTAAEFVELLEKKIDPKDRVLKIQGDESGSMRSGQVIVSFYNVPKSARGTDADNNRFAWTIQGFDRQSTDVKAIKVKIEERINSAPFSERTNWKLRGKTGTPQQVGEYLAKHIHKLVAELEPRISKHASYDSCY